MPYCTGDVYLGQNTYDYGSCVDNSGVSKDNCTARHHGTDNAMIVVDYIERQWLQTGVLTGASLTPPSLLARSNVSLPFLFPDLLCMGDSAGAYGALAFCGLLLEKIRAYNLNVAVTILGDSGMLKSCELLTISPLSDATLKPLKSMCPCRSSPLQELVLHRFPFPGTSHKASWGFWRKATAPTLRFSMTTTTKANIFSNRVIRKCE